MLCCGFVSCSAIGCCWANYLEDANYIWMTTFGFCHDVWNNIKQANRKFKGGIFWNTVQRFTAVRNVNSMPFRSGAWGNAEQQTHADLIARFPHGSSDGFLEAAKNTAKMHSTEFAFSNLGTYWREFGTLPTATECGPILKQQRWMSIQEC